MSKFFKYIPVALCLLIIAVAVISWIGAAYGWGCRSVLSQQGIRWAVANIVDNIMRAPWAMVAIITTTVGIVCESRIIQEVNDRKSLRVKRAYMIVAVMIIILIAIVAVLYLLPGNTLLSAFGTFNHSPLQRGLIPLIAIVIDIIAVVFGYASGQFTSLEDVYKAFVSLPINIAQVIIIMLIAPQLIAECQYVFHDFFLQHPNANFILRITLYYIPLLILIIDHLRNKAKKKHPSNVYSY